MSVSPLNHANLAKKHRLEVGCACAGASRVKVYAIKGIQIGIPGVEEKGGEKLTFPRRWRVDDALLCKQWLRFATPDELAETPAGFAQQWWRPLEFQPKTLINVDGSVAHMEQLMGAVGDSLTALEQTQSYPEIQEPMCADVDDISTPPTPV